MQTKTTLKILGATFMSLILSACGGGGSGTAVPGGAGGGSGSSSTSTTTDWKFGSSSGSAFTSGAIDAVIADGADELYADSSASLSISAVTSTGDLIADSIPVTFSSSCLTNGNATIDGGTAITVTTGTASVQYNPTKCIGKDTITATAKYNGKTLTATKVLTIRNKRLGIGTGANFIPTKLSIDSNSAALFTNQTTNIKVSVVNDLGALVDTPTTVTFSSRCIDAQTSSITGGNAINSIGGQVNAEYKAGAGCVGDDTVKATINYAGSLFTATATIPLINNKRIGSGTGTDFTPSQITVSTGSNTLFENDTTQLSVNIVDNQGNLVSQPTSVTFDSSCISSGLSTIVGGNVVSSLGGVAKAQYKAGKCAQDDVITATIANGDTTAEATATLAIDNRRMGSGFGVNFVSKALELGVGTGSLSPGGSTTVTAYIVNSKGDLVSDKIDVTFSSPCLSSGDASITGGNTVTSANGKAVATYNLKGCAGVSGKDTISATATFRSATLTASADLAVQSDTAQTITFLDATPQLIAIKGTGGQETSVLRFKVLGQGGSPLKNVCVSFTPSTSAGGLALVPSKCNPTTGETVGATTDASGIASTTIQAGTTATAVRVTATVTINGTVLSTQSSALAVTTGIPDQNSMSLSLTDLAPVGWEWDGIQSTATIRMADAFNNPAPDGTAVTFTTSGGAITGSCKTASGACSVTWTSQQPRPIGSAQVAFADSYPFARSCPGGATECRSGRIKILATAIGNESFVDGNGNGVYDDITKDIFVGGYGIYNSLVDIKKNPASKIDIIDEPVKTVSGGVASAIVAVASTTYQIGPVLTPRTGSIYLYSSTKITSVSLKNGATTYVKDTDYTLDSAAGQFTVLPGSPMIGKTISATYTKPKCSPATPNSTASVGASNSCDDLGEAYLDGNLNGKRDTAEEFTDFNKDGTFSTPNGIYDGVLCSGAALSNGDCTKNTVTIRQDITLTMSCSAPFIQPKSAESDPDRLPGQPYQPLSTDTYALGTSLNELPMLLADCNGNGLPAGTTVALKTDSLVNVKAAVSPSTALPMSREPQVITLSLTPDVDNFGKPASGTVVIEVTSPTPSGNITHSYSIRVSNN